MASSLSKRASSPTGYILLSRRAAPPVGQLRILDPPSPLLEIARVGKQCGSDFVVRGAVGHPNASARFVTQLVDLEHREGSSLRGSGESPVYTALKLARK